MASLADLRVQIDELDRQLLTLLERRAAVALEVASVKHREGHAEFYDPARERNLLDQLAASAGPNLTSTAVRAIFREVVSACRAVQKPLSVGFLGPDGTFSSLAARKLFGEAATYREIQTIEAVFDAVARGSVERGVVPLENSTEGAVTATTRALLAHELQIEREVLIGIRHALMSRASSLGAIARVYSHPQALAQCARWLQTNAPAAQLVPTSSTAAALQEALSDPAGAAVGMRESGALLGLTPLAESIEDRPDNQTRFVVISRTDSAPSKNDHTMIAFALSDSPGALRRALAAFESHQVNVARLTTFPLGNAAWEYVFLGELEGHRSQGPVADALQALGGLTDWVKVLGSFATERPRVR